MQNEQSVYENYYDYGEPLAAIPGHRILAINRGEAEKFPYSESRSTNRTYNFIS